MLPERVTSLPVALRPFVQDDAPRVQLLAGEQSAALPELAGGAELDDELELPQPDAATARATKATARSLLIISCTSRKRGHGNHWGSS